MRKRIGFLKNATARVDGYFSKYGEKLASARLTPEEVELFNGGPKKKKAAPSKKAAPVVATEEEAAVVVVTEVEELKPAVE